MREGSRRRPFPSFPSPSIYLSVLVQFGNDTPFTRREEEGEVVIGSVVRSFAFASAPPQSLSSRKSSRSLSSSSSSSPSSTAKPTTKSTAVSVCLSVCQSASEEGGTAQSVVASSGRRQRRFWVLARLVVGRNGGRGKGRQTLGFGFGREKGFKQRRNSYFKQKIEWRRDSMGGTDADADAGLAERAEQTENRRGEKLRTKQCSARTCRGHKDARQRAKGRRRGGGGGGGGGGEADPTDREREQPERKCYFSRVPLPRTNEKRRRRRLVISRETLQSWNLASGRARATWKPVNLTAVTLARSLDSRRKRHKRP